MSSSRASRSHLRDVNSQLLDIAASSCSGGIVHPEGDGDVDKCQTGLRALDQFATGRARLPGCRLPQVAIVHLGGLTTIALGPYKTYSRIASRLRQTVRG